MGSARRKKKISTKKLIVIIIVAVIIVLIAFLGIRLMRAKVTKEYGSSSQSEIKSGEVSVGSISTTVSGTGTLANEESEDITIPQAVEVTNIYVEAGDNVKKGDMLASVNSTSVVETMSGLQSQIDDLDKEINSLSSDSSDEKITSGVKGRIKKIYAKKGVSLASTMYDSKALMLISLDGKMAVDITADDLEESDKVTVTTSGGTKYKGSVESVWAGVATILVTDDGTEYGDEVKVTYGDGKKAEGTLYIHEEVSVTGYTGVTASVKVTENEKVSKGTTLLTVEDTDDTVNYQTILKKREAVEDDLQNLVTIYKEGAVYAKEDGLVTSITESGDDGTTTTSIVSQDKAFGMDSNEASVTTESEEVSDTVIAVSQTDKMTMVVNVDESEILSLSVGQDAEVTVDSILDESFAGTITAIDKVGTSSNGVTTYTATVEIERTDNMLEGMSASAVITIEGKENALLVPKDAVKKTSQTSYVYTSYDEETGELGDMVEVTTGLSDGSYTEIQEGVSEGMTVYYKESSSENSFEFNPGGFDGMPGGGMPGGAMPGGGMSGGGAPGDGSRPSRGSMGGKKD